MSLHIFQETLLKLYTQSPALEAFLENPEQFLSQYDLDAREKRAILKLPREELRRFQHELLSKRISMTHRSLLIRRGKTVMISSFGKHGPELSMSTDSRIPPSPKSERAYRVLYEFAEQGEPISLRAIVTAYRQQRPVLSLGDVFHLVRIIKKNHLEGKRVIAS